MSFALDEPGREALFVEVSFPAVSAVEALRVQPVQSVHSGRQALPPRLDQEVIVRPHETPRLDLPTEHLDRLLEKAPERLPVEIVHVDERAGDSA
jgi:hypothetical protein